MPPGPSPGAGPGAIPGPDPLAQLRGIHAPLEPSWWPPAPGWWLLAVVLLILLLLGLRWFLRRRRRRAPLRAARRELMALRERYRIDGDDSHYLRALSALLRRAALARFPQQRIAALSGEAWLAWLDDIVGSDDFSNGSGRVLADGPYAPPGQDGGLDAEALHKVCRRLLKGLRRSL